MQLRTTIHPGDIGEIVRMHGVLYAREYNLDRTFEGYVAAGLGAFAVGFDEAKDRLWIAEHDQRILGSIAIVGQPDGTAQLRWFLVHPDARGSGLGRRLITEALAFCRERGFPWVFLWTIAGLAASAHLYSDAGFRLTDEKTHALWGGLHTEQRYALKL
jgi:N-acetylglutamate synthase-like GNAT family acetyltransferase